MLIIKRQAQSLRIAGQSITEFLIAWPLLLLAICLLVQLLWLWWAQQTLATATQYAVRAGAINHGNLRHMRTTLITAMAGIKPQIEKDKAVTAAAKAVALQTAHYVLYGKINVVQPTAKQFKQFAERRWDTDNKRYVREIAVDHYHARQSADERPAWAAARRLKIETHWCEDLKLPLIAEFLGAIAKSRGQCLVGNLNDRPQWPLRSQAEHELLSGYRR